MSEMQIETNPSQLYRVASGMVIRAAKTLAGPEFWVDPLEETLTIERFRGRSDESTVSWSFEANKSPEDPEDPRLGEYAVAYDRQTPLLNDETTESVLETSLFDTLMTRKTDIDESEIRQTVRTGLKCGNVFMSEQSLIEVTPESCEASDRHGLIINGLLVPLGAVVKRTVFALTEESTVNDNMTLFERDIADLGVSTLDMLELDAELDLHFSGQPIWVLYPKIEEIMIKRIDNEVTGPFGKKDIALLRWILAKQLRLIHR